MIVDLICAVLLVIFVSNGIKKGGVKAILEILSFVVTIIAVMLFKDKITSFIMGFEPVMKWIEALTEQLQGPYPELVDLILPANDMASSMVSIIVNALGFVVTYIIVSFVLKAVLGVSDVLTSLPIIRPVNRFLGGVVGGAKAVIIIWVLMAVMLFFTASELYTLYTSSLADSILAKILFNNNLLFTLFR